MWSNYFLRKEKADNEYIEKLNKSFEEYAVSRKEFTETLSEFKKDIERDVFMIREMLGRPYRNHTGKMNDIHAFYLYKVGPTPKEDKSMLIQVSGRSQFEAVENARHYMTCLGEKYDEWKVVLTATHTIYFTIDQDGKSSEPKPIDKYITDLLYVKDNFTEKPYEKGVITKIINNIKEKHAN